MKPKTQRVFELLAFWSGVLNTVFVIYWVLSGNWLWAMITGVSAAFGLLSYFSK